MRTLLLVIAALSCCCQCLVPVMEGDAGELEQDAAVADVPDAAITDAGVDAGQLVDAGPPDAGTSEHADGGAWWYRFRPGSYLMLTATGLDARGNVYVAGRTEAGALTGTQPTGTGVMFVSKFTRDGEALWSVRFGVGGGAEVKGMAVAPDGSFVVTGNTFGPNFPTLTLGSFALQTHGSSDVFMAGFDANGQVQWASLFGSSIADRSSAIALDVTGRAYVGAQIDHAVRLFRFSPNGMVELDVVVATRVGINASDLSPVKSIAADEDGNIYLSLQSAAGANFTGAPTTAHRFEDGFVASFTASGRLRWLHQLRTSLGNAVVGSGLEMRTVMIDRSEVVVCGHFPNQVDFGSGPIDGGTQSFFLARYASSDGALRRLSVVNDVAFIGYGLTRTPDQRLVLTARWRQRPIFDTHALPPHDGIGIITFSNGSLERARPLSELDAPTQVSPVLLDAEGRLVFTVSFLRPDTLRLTHFDDLVTYDSLIVSLPPP